MSPQTDSSADAPIQIAPPFPAAFTFPEIDAAMLAVEARREAAAKASPLWTAFLARTLKSDYSAASA